LVFAVGITVVLESVMPPDFSEFPVLGVAVDVGLGISDTEDVAEGDALGFGVAEGDALGFGVAEGDALGFGVAEGDGVGVKLAGITVIVDFTGVVAMVTRLAIATFLIAAGVTGAELLALEFEGPAFLFQIAVQIMLLVPTVTTVLAAVVTELQLHPPNE
jgi:hypothetical protein